MSCNARWLRAFVGRRRCRWYGYENYAARAVLLLGARAPHHTTLVLLAYLTSGWPAIPPFDLGPSGEAIPRRARVIVSASEVQVRQVAHQVGQLSMAERRFRSAARL